MGHDTIAAVPALLNHSLLVILLQLERGGHARSFKLHHPSKTRAPTGPQRGFMHTERASMQLLGATEYYIEWNHALRRENTYLSVLCKHAKEIVHTCWYLAQPHLSARAWPRTLSTFSVLVASSHLAFLSPQIYEIPSLYSQNPEATATQGSWVMPVVR